MAQAFERLMAGIHCQNAAMQGLSGALTKAFNETEEVAGGALIVAR